MPLDYQQQKEMQAKAMQTGQGILERVIVWGGQIVKFFFGFLGDMLKQVMGK